jgi:predicted acyl esterase
MWAQAFDDSIFPSAMATAMFRRMPRRDVNRLYLDMGGHAAPTSRPEVEADKLRAQLAFFDHFLRGRGLRGPRVVYWTRDPNVKVPADSFAYPANAWLRHTASKWPPSGVRDQVLALGADGTLQQGAAAGTLPLMGAQFDPGSDEVAQAALSATPLGANPLPPAATGTSSPGVVAGFSTPPFAGDTELSGDANLSVRWTPFATDTQLAAKLYDQAPDGTLTLLGRAVQGLRGAIPGQPRTLTFATNDFSVIVHSGHRIVLTIAAGDASFYKPYADSGAGGALAAGTVSTVTLPYRRR